MRPVTLQRFGALLLCQMLWGNGHAAPAPQSSAETIRSAATRAITLVQASQKTWRVDCRSCHHQYLPAIAFRVARAHGLAVDESIARRDAIKAFNWKDIDAAVQFRNVIETSMDLAYAFVAADATGLQPNVAMQAYARMIAARQQPAGDWEDHHERPPQSYSRFVQTAIALRALQLYSHPSERRDVEARVSRALEWVRSNEPHDTADRAWQLIGLTWADRSGVATAFRAVQARALVKQQQADGGWGWKVGRESDAYSTAEALIALHDSGGASVKSLTWRRGVEFLIRTQQADGSWRVATRLHSSAVVSPPYFDSGYPYAHDQYLSMTAASLAVEALALSLDFQQSPGGDLWKQDIQDVEPWVATVLFGSVAELKAMLDDDFDPNSATKSGGTTALMLAALDPEKIRLLLDRGANVNARAASGYSALMVAVQGREAVRSVKLLLARGAEVRSPDGPPKRIPSPMMLAVTIGASDVLPALRDAGDSIDGMLPVAARNGLKEAVGTLLDLGASIDEPWDRDGTTALERAILGNDLDLAKSLIARGANVNHIGDRLKFTPLHHAACVDYGDSAMVDLLLKSGAQPDLVTRDGQTALDLARKFRHTHLITSLQRVSLSEASK